MLPSSFTFNFNPTPQEWMRAKRCPVAAMTFVLAVVVLEVVFWKVSEPLTGIPLLQPRADEATVVVKRRLAATAGGTVVAVGDSSCMMGLNPAEVERTGKEGLTNLGTLSSFTMPGFLALAEQTLQSDRPPRAVAIVVLPQALEVTEQRARDFGLLGRYLLAYDMHSDVYTPSFADWRYWIFEKHRFNVFPSQFGGSFDAFLGRLERTRGWLPEGETYLGTAAPRTDFVPAPFPVDALLSFVRKAKEKSVPVLFWWSPSPADASNGDYRRQAHRKLLEVRASAPWLRVAQSEPPAWPPEKFGTITHLNPAGAKENSELFAKALRALLD